jgi:hypothetical protein
VSAHDVLAYWALPLLARARRVADELAEHGRVDPESCALLGNDIAELIGHSVTDQPPADELAELLRDEPAITSHLPGRRGTREHFLARVEDAKQRESAARTETIEPPPPAPCTVCRCQTCHGVIECDPSDFFSRGRWRHVVPRTFEHDAVPFDHTPGALFHGAPVACDGCGARPVDGVACVAPDGVHTWRPLPGPEPAAPVRALVGASPCDITMVHYFGPRDSAAVAARFDKHGHPPNCPAWAGPRHECCGEPADGWPHRSDCPNRAKAVHAECSGNLPCPLHGMQHLDLRGPKSREPAAPVEETPDARARRLDRERDAASSAYREAVQAADAAWRAIGGRP